MKEIKKEKSLPHVSIKWIKNKAYVYTWYYIKKSKRSEGGNRFKWTYIGPINGKGGEFIKSYSIKEDLLAKEEIFEKCKIGQFKIRRTELTSIGNFDERRRVIERIANRELAAERSQKLQEDIEKEAYQFIERMFSHFTAESFYKFLFSGGSLTDLYEATKKTAK